MSVNTEKAVERFVNVQAGVACQCPFPLQHISEVEVVYGINSIVALPNTDYVVNITDDTFSSFTVTPTTALINKINALISINDDETNFIVVRRVTPSTQSASASSVRSVEWLVTHLDRISMVVQQLQEQMYRTLRQRPNVAGAPQTALYIEKARSNHVLSFDDNLNVVSSTVADLDATLDALITDPVDDDVLTWANGQWVNKPPQAVGAVYYMSQHGISTSNTAAQNRTAMSALIEKVADAGGGQIVGNVVGNVRMLPLLKEGTKYNNLYFRGIPGFKLIGDSMGTTTQALIEIRGTTSTPTTLTADGVMGSNTITVASGAALRVGGPVLIKSKAKGAGTPEYFNGINGLSGYPLVEKQEHRWVRAIVGNTITLDRGLYDSYDTASHDVDVVPINELHDIVVDDFYTKNDAADDAGLTNGNGPVGFVVKYCDRLRFRGGVNEQWQNAAAIARECFFVVFEDRYTIGRAEGVPDDCYYGDIADGCDYVVWVRCRMLNGRRPVDTGATRITRNWHQAFIDGDGLNGSIAGTHHAHRGSCRAISGRNLASGVPAIIFRGKDSAAYDCEDLPGEIRLGATISSGVNPNGCSAGRVDIQDVTWDLKTGSGYVRSYMDYDRLTILNTYGEGATAEPVRLRGGNRKNTYIAGNRWWISGGAAPYGIYMQNNIESGQTYGVLKSEADIIIGVNYFFGLNGAPALRLESTDTATPGYVVPTNRVWISRQITDDAGLAVIQLRRNNFGSMVFNEYDNDNSELAHSGKKNRLLNPDCRVNQINKVTTSVTGGTVVTIDGVATRAASQAFRTRTQADVSSDDIKNAFRSFGYDTMFVTQPWGAVGGAPGASDDYRAFWFVPGLDWRDLSWGTANAKPVSVRLCVRPTQAGTHCVFLQNGAEDRSFVHTFVGVAFTAQEIEFIVPGCTDGTWPTDGAVALKFGIDLGAGSNFETATPDVWVTGNKTRVAGAVQMSNVADSSIAYTGARIVEGRRPIPKEIEPYSETLRRCQEQYKVLSLYVPDKTVTYGNVAIHMRAVPSVTVTGGTPSGFDTTGTTKDVLVFGQTTKAQQTLTLDALPTL